MPVYYLVDKSGSMDVRKTQVVHGLNEFLDSQRDLSSTISLYLFSNEVEPIVEHRSIHDCKPLSLDDYEPMGSTSLYDAMGLLLETKMRWNSSDPCILIILTDGEDNSSYLYSSRRIRELIELHSSQLELVFVGSNQQEILFPSSQPSHMDYDDDQIDTAMRVTTDAVLRFQTQRTQSIEFTPLERERSKTRTL